MTEVELLLGLVMLAGLVGVLVPVLPGLLVVVAAAVLWALSAPSPARWGVAVGVGVIVVAGIVAAAVVPARRASVAGAPRSAVVAGMVGMVIGFFAIPVIGALVGFPAGVFVAELLRLHDPPAARATTAATLRGVGAAIVIQLVAGVTAIAVWAVAALVL